MIPEPDLRGLAARLVRHLQEMVRRGETSERSLARLTLYSQPHIHNILHGKRRMTLELADQLMSLLGIPVLALLTQEELGGRSPARAGGTLPVPVLEACLEGGKPFPSRVNSRQPRPFPVSDLAGIVSPALARLGTSEDSMLPTLWPGDLVLLDRSPLERRCPSNEGIYAISWKNKGWIARCRRAGRALAVVVDNARAAASPPETISLANREILDVVRGRIVRAGRQLPKLRPEWD
jgi:hypothetical protein